MVEKSPSEIFFDFILLFSQDSKMRLGWRIKAGFKIGLHSKDLPSESLRDAVQQFLNGVGRITHNKAIYDVRYIVTKLEDLIKVIIPHFQSYSLLTHVPIGPYSWVQVTYLIVSELHLTIERSGFVY